MNLPAELPDIDTAKLPASYEAARHALAECVRADECMAWANKAEALASYAKQSKDETLRKMCDRIQARAIRRCGELLKQIEPARGANQNIRDDTVPKDGRTAAADAAGLSERQRKTALRVANVPEGDFERQVESEDPPTVTALAQQGTRPVLDLGGIKPMHFANATQALGILERFATFAQAHDAREIADGVTEREVERARANVSVIDGWLDVFVTEIGE